MENEEEIVIGYYTDTDLRIKIDKQLHKMAMIESNLGTDSTPSEVKRAIKKKTTCMGKIKKLDLTFYKTIAPDEDDE